MLKTSSQQLTATWHYHYQYICATFQLIYQLHCQVILNLTMAFGHVFIKHKTNQTDVEYGRAIGITKNFVQFFFFFFKIVLNY